MLLWSIPTRTPEKLLRSTSGASAVLGMSIYSPVDPASCASNSDKDCPACRRSLHFSEVL
jgi:hypothetical protein